MVIRKARRDFLKTAAVGAGAVAGVQMFGAPYVLRAAGADKLRVAVIGCGGQGTGTHIPAAVREKLVAIVEPDEKCQAGAMKKAKEVDKNFDPSTVKIYSDYRKLFDEMAKGLDAIHVATPNHHHAPAALMAMKLGIAAYVEKPMCYDVSEARLMAEWSKKYKVATQMGNQGHSNESSRRLCEYIWAGAIGDVKEVFCWSNRSNGGVGPRPPTLPVPAGMVWENWIGPAPFRDYHKDLHPHEWHGWHDFGNGSLGNLACHVMDCTHWALKLEHPTSIVVEEQGGGTDERYPTGTKIRWDFPARGDMPPVKVYWYDGKKKGVKNAEKGDYEDAVGKDSQFRPPLCDEIEKKYNRKLDGSGTIYVGEKGLMYTDTYGGSARIIPEEQHKATPMPPAQIPRIKGSHVSNFYDAVRGGPPACSNFEYASKLTEIVCLGCLAVKAGLGKKVEWDGPNMKCTNIPELNKYLKRDYRKGWEV